MVVIYGLTHNYRQMVRKRGRPPSSKRKEREPLIAARIPDDLLKSLQELAKQRGGRTPSAQTLSAEVRQALQFWVYRNAISRFHNSRLGIAIAVLADRVEEITKKSWIDDPLTRQVVCELLLELMSHILRPLSKPVTVPADIKEQAGLILTLLKHVTGSPSFVGTVIIDDPGLAMILQDLNRNLGSRRANVETRPALIARRKQQKGKKR